MKEEKTGKEYLETLEKKDGKFIIKLDDPIEYGKDVISELEFTEPKAKHMRMMPANPTVSDMLDIIGQLCAQPKSVIDELSLGDLNKATEFFEAFS